MATKNTDLDIDISDLSLHSSSISYNDGYNDGTITGQRSGYNDGYQTGLIHGNVLCNEIANISAFIHTVQKLHNINNSILNYKQVESLNKLQNKLIIFPLYTLNHQSYTQQLHEIRSLYKKLNSNFLPSQQQHNNNTTAATTQSLDW